MPANTRHGARDLLIRALYQWQLAGHDHDELIGQFELHADFSDIDQIYFRQLLQLVIENAESLDRIIAELADRAVGQLDATSRAILLLGLAEFKHRLDVPTKVIINEAVELAKRYGPVDSYRFVNAVLDKAAQQITERDGMLTG